MLERAPRWAAEAARARSAALLAQQQKHLAAAVDRDRTVTTVADMARLTENIAPLIEKAAAEAAAHKRTIAGYRADGTAWAAAASELSAGAPSPDFGVVPGESVHQAASEWAPRAHQARSSDLLKD